MAGEDTELDRQADIVLRAPLATAFIATWRYPRNPGTVMVISNEHHENLYELPPESGHAVHDVVRAVAVGMKKAYGCDGVTVRQHNDRAGGQEVWHYHVHVFPRWHGDDVLTEQVRASEGERAEYVARLTAVL